MSTPATGKTLIRTVRWIAPACLILGFAQGAFAYVGPGAGLTVIGTVVAFLSAVVLAIVGFVWYPVKRILRKLRSGSGPTAP